MNADRVVRLAEDLDRIKRIAVGSGCPAFPRAQIAETNVSFTVAVTAIWKWYSEKLRHDLHFLTPRAHYKERIMLRDFSLLLDGQRHANEHADFDRANEAQEWRASIASDGDDPSDGEMIDALLEELVAALDTLTLIAVRVTRDTSGVAAWRTHETRSPESEIQAVLADIGRDTLPQRRVDTVVRRFEGHPKLRSARTPQDRARIAAAVAMEMSLEPLSIPYSEILDEFGLIGDSLGLSVLLVAHGVEAAGITGAGLLPVLRRAWSEVQSGAS